jgi:lambda family phage minor tail protein L
MPLPLSDIATQEKNKLGTDSIFLLFLQLIVPGDDDLYYVRNSESIDWNGQTWNPAPFEIDSVTESKDEVPQTNLKISNISMAMRRVIVKYDYYLKTHATRMVEISFFIVNTKSIAADAACDPEDEWRFQIADIHIDHDWVSLVLSAYNPYKRRFPQYKIMKDGCNFIFKSALCGYTGTAASCDKTLGRCRELENSARFGAFPGVGFGGIVVTSR